MIPISYQEYYNYQRFNYPLIIIKDICDITYLFHYIMSTQKNSIYQQKAAIKEEHQKRSRQEDLKLKSLESILEAKKQAIERINGQVISYSTKIFDQQNAVQAIQTQRQSANKQLQTLARRKEQTIRQLNQLSQNFKSTSSQIQKDKIKQQQLRSSNSQIFNFNYSTPQIQKQIILKNLLSKIQVQKKKLSQINNLRQKAIEKANIINKSNSQKLLQINNFVTKQQNAQLQIKRINQVIKAHQYTKSSLQQQVKKTYNQIAQFKIEVTLAVRKREDAISYLPYSSQDESVFISNQGMQWITKHFDPKCPQKYFYWTSDYKVQMPIFLKKTGLASNKPYTLIQMWQKSLEKYGDKIAFSYQISDNVWKSLTYKEYYAQCVKFGKACISLGLSDFTSVMIMGFNSPQWVITFFGAIFGRFLPIGMYTTNNPDTCEYIANHSQGQLVVLEDKSQLQKYFNIIGKCPKIRYFVIYKEKVPTDLPEVFKGRVFSWQQFMERGHKFKATKTEDTIEYRQSIQKPGHCASFIYTSGTTGMPKAVMVSHDNYTFAMDVTKSKLGDIQSLDGNGRVLTYLPMSHMASQIVDILGPLSYGSHVFFPHPSVLQNNMLKYLLVSKPKMFLGVPRVWQKLQQRLSDAISNMTGLKKKLLDWAMSIGIEGTFAQIHNKPTPRNWWLAKRLFNKIKLSLGLDECQIMIFGAAPMKDSTRQFFLKLNISLLNGYGMSETSGAITLSDKMLWTGFSDEYLKEAGTPLQGHEIYIEGQDKQGRGQICMRGRLRFMGYYKNDQENKKTIDRKGFVHSGDEGKLDSKNNIFITGRIKELIITAGGENIPPVVIENEISKVLPIISQVVVIGDKRKYLTCLICLKLKSPTEIADQVVEIVKKKGSKAKTLKQAIVCPVVNQIIKAGIAQANNKAISNAQKVQKYTILPLQFTIELGILTPTLKLKRNVISEMFNKEIEAMYIDSKM